MRLIAALLFVTVQACSVTRPDQDNFEIDASKGSIQSFVDAISKDLHASVDRKTVKFHDSDPSEMFTIEARNTDIVVSAEPDDRCNPNAPWHATYKERHYRADLVYRTSSQPKRAEAKQKLINAAKQTGLSIQPFKEC